MITVMVGHLLKRDITVRSAVQLVPTFFAYFDEYDFQCSISIDGEGTQADVLTVLSVLPPQTNMALVSADGLDFIKSKIRSGREQCEMSPNCYKDLLHVIRC